MRLEIDIPERHYNNIMALDSINLGRAPYKGIIMYAINAIKRGKALKQEPMVEIDLDYVIKQKYIEREVLDKIRAEILEKCFNVPYENQAFDYGLKIVKWSDVREILDKYKAEVRNKYGRYRVSN